MYFKKFPLIYYPVTINGVTQYSILKDITINVRFIKEFLSNITLYDLYDVKDNETAEAISEKFYGTPYYNWIVMISNDRYDYINDFPLAYDDLMQYISTKYGDSNGYIVSSDEPLAIAVKNKDYEEKINESKRTIKIISKSIIERVVSDFVKAIK